MASEEKKRHYREIVEAWALAWMFPLAIGIGFAWGYWMDKKIFGTWPWLTAIFTGLGIIAGFLNLFRIALRNDTGSGRSEKPPRS